MASGEKKRIGGKVVYIRKANRQSTAAQREAAERKAFEESTGGTLQYKVEEHKIETRYIEGRGFQRGRYDDTVLSVQADSGGNLVFDYAQADSYEKSAPTNKTNYVTYTLTHGVEVDKKGNVTSYGINWDKVQSVSGQTYALRQFAKEQGLKWDSVNKRWKRP